MKLTRVLELSYNIDNNILLEYKKEFPSEMWSFEHFINWLKENYQLENLEEECEDDYWNEINGNLDIYEEFKNQLIND